MAAPITQHVDVSVLVEGALGESFNFGSLMGAFTHTITGNRLDGPYASTTELAAAGFTSTAAPEINAWAATVFGQPNGPIKQIYVGRIDAGDADITSSLDAIEAVDSEAFYLVNIESREAADILEAATWCESRNGDSLKFGIWQSADGSFLNGTGPVHTATVGGTPTDGDYVITFTGFGLLAPVVVTVSRVAGVPATNAALATAIDAAIDALIPTTLANVVTASTVLGAVVTITLARGLATGVISQSAPAPGTITLVNPDIDIMGQLDAGAYRRSILMYHQFDAGTTGYKDGAVASRMGGFRLDEPSGAAALAYKELSIAPYSPLSTPQALAIVNGKGNYHGRKRGFSFIWNGQTPAGPPYYADITTSIDWFVRRTEEAILRLQVGTPTKIGFDQAGILKFVNAVQGVLNNGVRNGHFLGDPGFEPFVFAPPIASISAADKAARILRLTSTMNKATFNGAIQKVVIVMRMNFGDDQTA
jgi:hypothetical protein